MLTEIEHSIAGFFSVYYLCMETLSISFVLDCVSQALVTCCNRLPREVVDGPGLLVFKRHLDSAFNHIL